MGMPGPQMVSRYGDDFKLAAVRLSQAPGVYVKDVAESLCVHPNMLTKWRKLAREGALLSDTEPKLDTNSVAELRRLRDIEQKFKRLQMEHDLLKNDHRGATPSQWTETLGVLH
jgi:transposase